MRHPGFLSSPQSFRSEITKLAPFEMTKGRDICLLEQPAQGRNSFLFVISNEALMLPDKIHNCREERNLRIVNARHVTDASGCSTLDFSLRRNPFVITSPNWLRSK